MTRAATLHRADQPGRLPALALPVPSGHRLPAGLQLIGPPGSEELLLATGAVIEAAAGYARP